MEKSQPERTPVAIPSARRKEHTLALRNRERLSLEGVRHVESFDHREIVLTTDAGPLTIQGEDLRIKELNVESSTLTVHGRVRSLAYSDEGAAEKGKGLLARLFR